ncbi:MAG: hypothetical protein VZT48_04460 [Bulleidia sp.]|nr:hypothetical protein [Bulleidia sp.]
MTENPYLTAGNHAIPIRHIFELYNAHKRLLALGRQGINPEKKRMTQVISYNYIVDQTMAMCSQNTRMIIRNEFMVPMEDKHWYEAYWTRSTYDRRRKKAYIEFLTILHQVANPDSIL